jgi:hypothetical protein
MAKDAKRDAGKLLASVTAEMEATTPPAGAPTCVIATGERRTGRYGSMGLVGG